MNLEDLQDFDFFKLDIEEELANAQKIVREFLQRDVARADPLMLFIKSMLSLNIQQAERINDLAKQNLLRFARNILLDYFGAAFGVARLPATPAKCTAQIALSTSLNKPVTIKQGTRITAGDGLNFALDEPVTFLSGEILKNAKFTCETAGLVGNDYAPGSLCSIVDPQPFLASITNITSTGGGADLEDDDIFRARIALAPESFSCAGSFGAYEFFTKQASSLISDVLIDSENPGEVDIYFLQENDLPTDEVIEFVNNTLTNRLVRPLTDLVLIKKPLPQFYAIDLVYYVNQSDYLNMSSIQSKIEGAVDDFIVWQRSKIGRDVNKSELVKRVIAAGAKRVEVFEPTFRVVDKNEVAVCNSRNVIFAGLEDD